MSELQPKLRILTTLDGSSQSEASLLFARLVAAGNADVTVVRVVSNSEPIFDPSGLLVIPAEEEIAAQLDHARVQSETSVRKFDDEPGVRWDIVTLTGDPAEAILDAAELRHVDFIVMASTGKGAFARMTLGSVADRVARTAAVPVLIVRNGGEAVIERLLVPIDGSERAAAELPVARDLARRIGAPIEFMYVVDYASVSTGLGGFGPEAQAQFMAEATASGQMIINEAVAQIVTAGIPATGMVYTGNPAEAILQEAKRGDLVVMCSHGRSGFTRWLIGSVAEKLIHGGSTPIMLVPVRTAIRAEAVVIAL